MNAHMEQRMAQLALVMGMVDTGIQVDVLRLADAVQLCDERYFLEEVTKWENGELVRLGWEILRLNSNGTHAGGVSESLFPTIRAGFVWLGLQLLAHPPKERAGMFPYFDVFTGVVVHDKPRLPRKRNNRSKPKYASEPGAYENVLSPTAGNGSVGGTDARGHRGTIGVLLGEKGYPSFSAIEGLARAARTYGDKKPIG